MNILSIIYRISSIVQKYFYAICFLLLKKPFYMLSYNTQGNQFKCHGFLLHTSIKIRGKNNQLIIGKGVKINNAKIVISGTNNKLIIHENVVFHEGGRVKLEDEENLIEIGENSDFVDCFFAVSDCKSKVVIGRDCMFSAKIIIRNSDVHSILNEHNERINPARDTIIGDRVWVGYGVNILKGVHIGNDAVIGIQSVVAGDVFAGCVAVGNPAKVVKSGVHWCRERI